MAHDGFTQARVRAEFLGMHYAPLSSEAAIGAIAARAMAGGPFAYVVAPRIGDIIALDRTPYDIAPLFASAWLTLNASARVARLAAASGVDMPLHRPEALAGALLARFADPDEPVAIIGEASRAAGLAARYGLNNVRWSAPPPMSPDGAENAAAFVARARARFTILFCDGVLGAMIARATMQRGDALGVGLCAGAPPAAVNSLPSALVQARDGVAESMRLAAIWRYWLLAAWAERASISARSAR